MTNHYHEANRKGWDTVARAGRGQVDNSRNWRDCYSDSKIYFLSEELELLAEIAGKKVCVLGSGDNVHESGGITAVSGIIGTEKQINFSHQLDNKRNNPHERVRRMDTNHPRR